MTAYPVHRGGSTKATLLRSTCIGIAILKISRLSMLLAQPREAISQPRSYRVTTSPKSCTLKKYEDRCCWEWRDGIIASRFIVTTKLSAVENKVQQSHGRGEVPTTCKHGVRGDHGPRHVHSSIHADERRRPFEQNSGDSRREQEIAVITCSTTG